MDEGTWREGEGSIVYCCVYMPTDSSSVSVLDGVYEKFKEDVLSLRRKGG